MVAPAQFFPYSQIQHVSAGDLLHSRSHLIEAFFPRCQYPYGWGHHVASFFLCVGNIHMLVLADALSFAGIRNPGEYFGEVCPVIFDKVPRACHARLKDLVSQCGDNLPDLPKMVAFQIEQVGHGAPPCDPHIELFRLLNGDITEGYISCYKITLLPNTWTYHPDFPDWKGIVFQQILPGNIEGPLRVWAHELNPKVQQRALESAEASVAKVKGTCDALKARAVTERGKPEPDQKVVERIEDDLRVETERLEGCERFLGEVKGGGVASGAGSTFQAEAKVLINNVQACDLLVRHLLREMTCLVRTYYLEHTWDHVVLGPDHLKELEQVCQMGKNILFKEVQYLRESGCRVFHDWDFFYHQGLMPKRAWLMQTNEQFIEKYKGEHEGASPEVISKMCAQNIKKKLTWIMEGVIRVGNDLKFAGEWDEMKKDMNILNKFIQVIRSVSRANKLRTAYVEDQLAHFEAWKVKIVGAWKKEKKFVLFKRVSNGGHIDFGPARLPEPGFEKGANPIETRDGVHLLMHDVRF